MESQSDLNEKIILVTIKIKENFPELTKYLDEMPGNFLSDSGQGVNDKNLEDYLNSLNKILETYSMKHQGTNSLI